MTATTALIRSVADLLQESDPERRLNRLAGLAAGVLNVPFTAAVVGDAGSDTVAVASGEAAPPAATVAALTAWLESGWLRTVDLPPGDVRRAHELAGVDNPLPEALAAPDAGTVLVAALPVSGATGWLVAGAVPLSNARERDLRAGLEALACLAAPVLAGQVRAAEDGSVAVLDGLPDAIEVYDAEGRLLHVNRRHEQIFGVGLVRPGMTQESAAAALAAATAKQEGLSEAIRPTGPAVMELTTPSGETLTLERKVFPLRDGRGAGAVAVYRDLTSLKHIEELKDGFLSYAAHELKTPLTPILGYSQLLQRRLRNAIAEGDARAAFDFEQAASDADQVRDEGKRLNRLVEQLLDVARIQTGRLEVKPVSLDLRVFVPETLERLKAVTAGRTVAFSGPRERMPLTVNADRERLKQVLANLLENAVRFSPPDARLEVRLRALAGSPRHAQLTVRDAGAGIEPVNLERIFELYVDPPVPPTMRPVGMRVGLFVCRALVRRQGGRLWAESAGTGKGSAFHVELPLVQEQANSE